MAGKKKLKNQSHDDANQSINPIFITQSCNKNIRSILYEPGNDNMFMLFYNLHRSGVPCSIKIICPHGIYIFLNPNRSRFPPIKTLAHITSSITQINFL